MVFCVKDRVSVKIIDRVLVSGGSCQKSNAIGCGLVFVTITEGLRRYSMGCVFRLGVGISLAFSVNGYAALGGHSALLGKEARALSAARVNADVYQKYFIQELKSDSTSIKEYVRNDGIVFAVSWSGRDTPDLRVLLGGYSPAYEKSLKESKRIRGVRHHSIEKENLVVQKWGQMRQLEGRAYDPSLIPAGVTINDIQ